MYLSKCYSNINIRLKSSPSFKFLTIHVTTGCSVSEYWEWHSTAPGTAGKWQHYHCCRHLLLASAGPSRHNKELKPRGSVHWTILSLARLSMGGCCGEDIPVLGKHSLGYNGFWQCSEKRVLSVLIVKRTFHTQESGINFYNIIGSCF